MIIEIILGLFALVFIWYFYLKYVKWTYFTKRGILQFEVSFPFGNFNDLVFQKRHLNDVVKDMYFASEGHKMYGIYSVGVPALTIRDPEMLRQIMVKDFDHFVDKQPTEMFSGGLSKTDRAWARQLTNLSGDEWKEVRSTFSPIFTSGKMKAMMFFIKDCSKRLTEEMGRHATTGEEFELKKIFGKFSMDTIASCVFGVDAQSFSSQGESPFVKNASSIFNRSFVEMLKLVAMSTPGLKTLLSKVFKMTLFKANETQFFIDVIEAALRERRSNPSSKNDLIEMMLEALKEDSIQEETFKDQFDVDSELKIQSKPKGKDFDELTIVATAMVMLVAGYDTTAQTLSYAAFELAKKPEILERLQDEIDAAYEDANGETPDYNTVQSLPYLDMVIHESLRLHPPAGLLTRLCIKDYKSGELEIEKGTMVHIPVAGIHSDPKYYPNPEVFNPEHFSKENKAKRSPYTFQGFGQGPRSCIAMRFALLEAKVALMSVVRQFNLKTSPKTVEKVVLDPKASLALPLGGLWIKVEKRQV